LSSFNLFKIYISCNMSFAKKHMYKQGWVEGKGLGRFETGMKSAIKVKIKRDQAGVGHDMAEEFTFQWWDHVFNRAASKIKLKGEDDSEGSDSEDDAATSANASFDISNKKPTKKKYDPKQILYGRFVSGGLLVDENQARLKEMAEVTILDVNGGVVVPASAPPPTSTNDDSDSSGSDDSEEEMKLYAAAGLPEDELLRRCGGRTAHKGARHGLKASAKLERIERQEGSAKATPVPSPAPSPATVQAASPTVDEPKPLAAKKEKKKRKKRSAEAESASVHSETINVDDPPPKKKKKKKDKQEREVEKREEPLILAESLYTENTPMETETPKVKKRKKKKQQHIENEKLAENGASSVVVDPIPTVPNLEPSVLDETQKKKKKKKKIPTEPSSEVGVTTEKFLQTNIDNAEEVVKKEKKLKKKKKKQLDGAA